MAKNKKNRQADYSRQKIEEARRRNDYFKRLKILCDMVHPDLYPMLNMEDKIALYMVRGLPFKIVADGKVPKGVMESINGFAGLIQKNAVIPLGEHKISLTDYLRYLSPLEWLIRPEDWEPSDARPNPARFKGISWYETFFETEERFGIYYVQINKLLMTVSGFASDLRYNLYYVYFKEKHGGSNWFDAKKHNGIYIQPRRTERKHIKLRNGEMRNALRLTAPLPSDALKEPAPENERFIEFSLPPAIMGVKGLMAKKVRPVYISEHALNRLDERTGCGSSGYMQMFVWMSLLSGSAREMADDRLLLDYVACGQKIGYLVLSVQRNSILIHTFLLLTANGTPEGRKLREQLGLQKADNQYLGIDKLSTFIHSDILQHEDVCEWFRNAGCESLLKICELLKDNELWQQDSEQIRLAERMKEYLKIDESADAWDFTEETETEETERDED
jgi:hypothetical protein